MATGEGSATYTLFDDADALASAFRHVDVEFRCQDRGPFRGRPGFAALQGTEVQPLALSQTSVSHAFTGRFGSPAPDGTPVALGPAPGVAVGPGPRKTWRKAKRR